MDKENILKYQEKDAVIFKKERDLEQNENKKVYTNLIPILKDLQNKSKSLEIEAEKAANEFEQLKKIFNSLSEKTNKILTKKSDDLNEKESQTVTEALKNLLTELNQIEKKSLGQAEKMSVILSQFEESKKNYFAMMQKYKNNKDAFDKVFMQKKPEIDKLKSELLEIEKAIDPSIIARYKLIRQDKIFPVFVPLLNKSCGGCQMELSTNIIDNIKQKGYIECENCRRFIY